MGSSPTGTYRGLLGPLRIRLPFRPTQQRLLRNAQKFSVESSFHGPFEVWHALGRASLLARTHLQQVTLHFLVSSVIKLKNRPSMKNWRAASERLSPHSASQRVLPFTGYRSKSLPGSLNRARSPLILPGRVSPWVTEWKKSLILDQRINFRKSSLKRIA